ncbi:hypothetical protein C8R44DRAFT_762036 [Mycena epipterygia]|nr:hypothetical protein C8R44DRAFT_762036 [Mycena epipterygia]
MAGVDLLFGPMLIGVMLNMMLYGVMFTQMLVYYQRYTNDSGWIRYLMLYLFIVETVNLFVEVGIIYEPLIIQYGTEVATVITPKLLPGDSVLIAIVSAPIQLFTAWRLSVITKSLIMPFFIALLSLASSGGGLLVSIMVSMNPEFRDFPNFLTEVVFWLISSAVCDVVIAVAMCYALYTRKTTFNKDIDGKISRIIRLTAKTGSLTAIAALADVVLFLVFPRTSLNFIVDFPLSNLYTCSILAMLNSREKKGLSDAENFQTVVPQTFARGKTHLEAPPPTQMSQTKIDIYTATEQVASTAPKDAPSERSYTLPRSHALPPDSDYYNYNGQTPDIPRPMPMQLELRPQTTTLDRPMPRRF